MSVSLGGSWSLLEYESRYEDGSTRLPMGDSPQGVLVYTPDGFVSVHMTRQDRVLFESGDWLRGTPDEIIHAYESYLAYYGRYTVNLDQKMVMHHIESCTFPNWSGSHLVRHYALDGDRLTLTTPPVRMDGGIRLGYLVWERR